MKTLKYYGGSKAVKTKENHEFTAEEIKIIVKNNLNR